MTWRVAILVAVLAVACKGTAPADPNDEAPVPADAPVPVPDPLPAPDQVPASAEPAPAPADACCAADPAPSPGPEAAVTPASMYAACRERVELPEAAGECKTDADCGATGCGGEICTSTANGAVMSTCEVRPCFGVLDHCGCVAGRCDWSLRAEVPPRREILLPQ